MNTWRVEVLVRVNKEELPNDDLIELSDRATDEHDWYVGRWEFSNGFTVADYFDADDLMEPAHAFRDRIGDWIVEQGVDGYIAGVRVVEEEVFMMEAEFPIPDMISASEAASILRVSRQRVHELATTNAGFPEPHARPPAGPLWLREDIEEFDRRWERKPGRPRKTATG